MYVNIDDLDIDKHIDELSNNLKNQIIEYLINNHNITWLNDDIEREIYKVVLSLVEPFILNSILRIVPDPKP